MFHVPLVSFAGRFCRIRLERRRGANLLPVERRAKENGIDSRHRKNSQFRFRVAGVLRSPTPTVGPV